MPGNPGTLAVFGLVADAAEINAGTTVKIAAKKENRFICRAARAILELLKCFHVLFNSGFMVAPVD
jgi:hypothetical protein